VVRVPFDVRALKGHGKPVGAALRVGTFPSRFADEPEVVQLLERVIHDVKAEAKAKRIVLSEIQFDYDCPESKLEDYRGVLPALKRAASPVPLTITALPTWLLHRKVDFRRLIQEPDGYVLQLHSLAPPSGPGENLVLVESAAARGWVEKAARYGRPFRAALPTYGYMAAFDAQGKFLAVIAEGPLVSWSRNVTVRPAYSDPAAMAELVRDWTRDRPAALRGVLWFRLPVAGDRFNWSWPTLHAVREGRVPRRSARFVLREPEPGLVEIDLVNAGESEMSWPPAVRIRWRGEPPIAADALAVYGMGPARRGEIRLFGAGAGLLRPGERHPIAWLRFAARTEVQVELP
jgi:hypothetical protein